MSPTNVYHGSCHCGDVQYQVRLTFPPVLDEEAASDANTKAVSIYKCNCSTCLKMNFFHLHTITPTDDFILTSPSTIEELGDYRVFSRKHGWYFCKKCGVRTFGVGGKWEQVDLDGTKWAGKEKAGGEGNSEKVWRTVPGEYENTGPDGEKDMKPLHYLSINAVTMEPGGDIDLKMWHEKGWIFYVECRDETDGEDLRFGEPYPGGCY